MVLVIAITVFVVLLIWGVTRNRTGGAIPSPLSRGKKCQFERVDPNSDRTLQEYRCSGCGQTAYGRVDQLPATRTCKQT